MSAYIQMGLTWMALYFLIEHLSPGSFAGVRGGAAIERAELLYFSFTTLTTTGLGDILPLNAPARSVTIMESMFGVLYPTVLIARLVGLHIVHSNFPRAES
jgi:hypothetical protein